MYIFDLDNTDCSYINYDEVEDDPTLSQDFALISFENQKYIPTSFWGRLLNADEMQKAKPGEFQIPPIAIRKKIFLGCRVKIGIVDPVSRKCKLAWVTLLSRADTPRGPVYSAFFNNDLEEFGISRFDLIPYLLPINIFALDFLNFILESGQDFLECKGSFHIKDLKHRVEIMKEFNKIPKKQLLKTEEI
jgi:hypothetical protein